ncbi:MAG TPA: hypothetical protein VF529_07700 [Solirubrobacteraceae bacterium]|jgi:hypothetical protein
MNDLDWQRGLLRTALEGFVDEEIEAAHYAMRHRGWEDSWRKGPEWIKRHFFASDHPKDHTGTFNVVVVTPSRVMVFNAKPKAPLLKVRRKIAEWPRGGVRVVWKGRTAVSHYNSGNSRSDHRIIRATFTWDGEEEPFILDFPTGPLSNEVLLAIRDR